MRLHYALLAHKNCLCRRVKEVSHLDAKESYPRKQLPTLRLSIYKGVQALLQETACTARIPHF